MNNSILKGGLLSLILKQNYKTSFFYSNQLNQVVVMIYNVCLCDIRGFILVFSHVTLLTARKTLNYDFLETDGRLIGGTSRGRMGLFLVLCNY